MRPYPLLICVALVAGGAAFAQGKSGEANDAVTLGTPATDMATAVVAAEKHVQGKAVRAEFEKRRGGNAVYDIEVVAGGKVFDVKVDADDNDAVD